MEPVRCYPFLSMGEGAHRDRSAADSARIRAFEWRPEPQAAEWVRGHIECARAAGGDVSQLLGRLAPATGTRASDWVDELGICANEVERDTLRQLGFELFGRSGVTDVWQHPGAKLPYVRLSREPGLRLVLRVESVEDFLLAFGLGNRAIEGGPGCLVRRVLAFKGGETELWVQERHGSPLEEDTRVETQLIFNHREAFLTRRRDLDPEEGFRTLMLSIEAAVRDLGTSYASDLFFEAERDYWYGQSRAARIQKARQDALGMGWGNLDHHAFHSSRRHYSHLIRVLEALGMRCRERIHAGETAGWGAQVLEHESTGVVTLASVDLSPEEARSDFPHLGLPDTETFASVGLWCSLRGEALLEAGMHHLAAQFDFDLVSAQLLEQGISRMEPVTNLAFLSYALTTGEHWPLAPERLGTASSGQPVTPEQAESLAAEGALGSHLGILQRKDGYKGFNHPKVSPVTSDSELWHDSRTGSS